MQSSGDLTLASLISALIAILGGSFAMFRYVQSEIRRVLDHTDSELAMLETSQSKIRHEKMNELQLQLGRMDLTLEQLRGVAVRREELLQMETRFSLRLEKMETKLDRVMESLPTIAERLDTLKQLQRQMISRNERIDRGKPDDE